MINSNLGRSLFLTVTEIRPLIALYISFKITAKPLQMDTWLLLTAYRKTPPPYPMVPSLTLHDLPFSYNTSVTDGQTDDRRTTTHANSSTFTVG